MAVLARGAPRMHVIACHRLSSAGKAVKTASLKSYNSIVTGIQSRFQPLVRAGSEALLGYVNTRRANSYTPDS